MSLFDLIRYPVTKDTTDFNHLPNEMWQEYIHEGLKGVNSDELAHEKATNAILIKIILEWED